MTKQKGIIRIALLVIVVALVAALVYIVVTEEESPAPQVDTVSSWKTYTSEKFGFELKYPSDWLVYEEDVSVTFTTKEKQERDRVRNDELYEKYCKNDDCGPLEFYNSGIQFFLDARPDAEEINISRRQTQLVPLGPENIAWHRYIIEAGQEHIRYAVKAGDQVYIFSVYPEYETELKNLLSIFFKFIPQDLTAGWKTYRNEEYGFEISYPAEFLVKEYDSPLSRDLHVKFERQIPNPYEPSDDFELWVTGNLEESLDNYYFGIQPSPGKTGELGGLVAKVFETNTGFSCAEGDCGEPAVAFVTRSDGVMYHLFFFGSPEESELFDLHTNILSTFKFTK